KLSFQVEQVKAGSGASQNIIIFHSLLLCDSLLSAAFLYQKAVSDIRASDGYIKAPLLRSHAAQQRRIHGLLIQTHDVVGGIIGAKPFPQQPKGPVVGNDAAAQKP